MNELENFPLTIWQETKEYEKEYEQAKDKLEKLKLKLKDQNLEWVKDFEFMHIGKEGYAKALLTNKAIPDEDPPFKFSFVRFAARCLFYKIRDPGFYGVETFENAKYIALNHGYNGWWKLDDLEHFLEGHGAVFEKTLYFMGCNDVDKNPKLYEEKIIENVVDDELNRLNNLWVLKNENKGIDETYSLGVVNKGLIFMSMDFTPFYDKTDYWKKVVTSWKHINKQQDGFYIDAKNVRIGNEQGIYIKAIKEDSSFVECVWPSKTPLETIQYLANDLVSKIKKSRLENILDGEKHER